MYLLITYDVSTSDALGAKRLRKVARICQDYGQRVQNSVFECLVDPAQFVSLKSSLLEVINKDLDSLRIYLLGKNYSHNIQIYGKVRSFEIEGELII